MNVRVPVGMPKICMREQRESLCPYKTPTFCAAPFVGRRDDIFRKRHTVIDL